jgi:glutathione peroxidase-family protein
MCAGNDALVKTEFSTAFQIKTIHSQVNHNSTVSIYKKLKIQEELTVLTEGFLDLQLDNQSIQWNFFKT